MAERCPLCMENMENGVCLSCGYRLPDVDDISALYNYEPDDYPQEQPAIREITPEIQMEEIYPNRPEPPKFKVRDDEGKTVTDNNHRVNLGKPDTSGNHHNTNTANTTNSNPYAGYTPGGASPSGSGNSPLSGQYTGYSHTDDVQSFLQKYWWVLLVSFLIPIAGIILYSTMKQELKQYKYSWLIWVAIVSKIILPF